MAAPRPTKETLSRSYILDTALALIDQKGLAQFSMRKLGQAMAVSPMAVYRYFPNQGALFDGVVESIWQQALTIAPGTSSATWQDTVIGVMTQFRRTLLQHPNVLTLLSTHPLVTESEFALVAEILPVLQEKGLQITTTTVFLINSLTAYTLGFVWAEAIPPTPGGQPDPALMQNLPAPSASVRELLAPIEKNQYTPDQQYLMGLNALLRGWE
ncbi:TetR/AcrR family transcriptional regulator [Schleiferilactobacillus shenzhenensis]|uniref:HTH tetR-type domain-containing protein n=1 Tax=Schleiferilactobacillus shenzhenensis LY-73 TaxID=1231336 RepID=U4TP31_9LACO|nr:TetR family transcriptional regulator [Schleiferilactobacillus shenzhenensis]ERL65974.1 hypothetical protein L248_2050 [Schleiferilactobacillus shenzhenensis LY-73]